MASNKDSYIPGTLSLSEAFGDAYETPLVNGRKMRFGVIGTGSMGMEHIETALAVGGAEIAGLFDTSPRCIEIARNKFSGLPGAKVFDSPEALCADKDIDAVVIATPNYTHFDIVQIAMNAGKHILLEKPMTHTPDDALKLCDIAGGYKKTLFLGFEYREKPVYREVMREVYERKSIGDVKMIHILEHRAPFLSKMEQWNKFSKYSGGTLVEKCCHYFDLFRWVLGSDPVRVYASGGQDVNFRGYEYNGERSDIIDNAFVTVDFQNGTRACLILSMFVFGHREEMTVCGNRAALYALDYPEAKITITQNPLESGREMHVTIPTCIAKTGSHGGSTFYEHRRFLDAVAGREVNYPSVVDGMWAIVMGAAGEESIRIGKPVMLDERYDLNKYRKH